MWPGPCSHTSSESSAPRARHSEAGAAGRGKTEPMAGHRHSVAGPGRPSSAHGVPRGLGRRPRRAGSCDTSPNRWTLIGLDKKPCDKDACAGGPVSLFDTRQAGRQAGYMSQLSQAVAGIPTPLFHAGANAVSFSVPVLRSPSPSATSSSSPFPPSSSHSSPLSALPILLQPAHGAQAALCKVRIRSHLTGSQDPPSPRGLLQGRGVSRRLQLGRVPPDQSQGHVQGWQIHRSQKARVRTLSSACGESRAIRFPAAIRRRPSPLANRHHATRWGHFSTVWLVKDTQ